MLGVTHPLIYFPLYEKSKIYLKKNWDSESSDKDQLSWQYVMISAVACKGMTSAITYPHEVLRARMQDIRKYELDMSGRARINMGIIYCARQLFREKGFVSFYDGFWVNLLRISPSYAITFVLYERFSVGFQRAIYGDNQSHNED